MALTVKNWAKFQHYHTGRGAPPWIKLYREILNDKEWFALAPDAAKTLISLWILAAEDSGRLPDAETIAFRLRIDSKLLAKHLIQCNHWIIDDASNVLANNYQVATPETETETETETTLVNSAKKPPHCPIDKIVDLYHKKLPELPRVCAITSKRESAIRARWKGLEPDTVDSGLTDFGQFFDLVRGSDFLMGKKPATNGHRVFKASLEWLVNESNFIKVIERTYHERV